MSGWIDEIARADGCTHRHTTPLIGGIGRSIWRALERAGHRRAARELMALAARHEPFDPELARRLRDAAMLNIE